jgi:hypothetical protein
MAEETEPVFSERKATNLLVEVCVRYEAVADVLLMVIKNRTKQDYSQLAPDVANLVAQHMSETEQHAQSAKTTLLDSTKPFPAAQLQMYASRLLRKIENSPIFPPSMGLRE